MDVDEETAGPTTSAQVRLPDAEHGRIQYLEASAKAQKATINTMQTTLAKQEAATTTLIENIGKNIWQTQTAVNELRQQNSTM